MRKLLFLVGFLSSLFATSLFADDATSTAFTLNTTAFLDKGALPVLYTCDGQDKSPELDWTNPPAKAQTFVILMTDPQAPGGTFYHWVVYNIPKSTTKLDEGVQQYPAGTMVGKNNFGKSGYSGPCPPKDTAHTYVITLYGLDTKLPLKEGASGFEVLSATKGHVVGTAELSNVYSRWIK